MVGKKGQLKIQQMIFMLLAVTFLFILVGLIFLSVRLSSLKKTASSLGEENAMLLVSKLANSPEFSCGNSFGGSRISCIDFDKLMILKDHVEDYGDFWGVAKIEIRIVYPNEGNVICSKSTYPDCSIIKLLDKNVNTLPANSNFVSLCRKDTNGKIIFDKCELARILVSSEDKG